MPIMSNVDCKKTGYNSRITDNMLCAGFPDGKKDSCQVSTFSNANGKKRVELNRKTLNGFFRVTAEDHCI